MVLDVLTLRGERITAVTAFVDPEIFARFGLPDELPARRAASVPSLVGPAAK
jgi:hypothetical protein